MLCYVEGKKQMIKFSPELVRFIFHRKLCRAEKYDNILIRAAFTQTPETIIGVKSFNAKMTLEKLNSAHFNFSSEIALKCDFGTSKNRRKISLNLFALQLNIFLKL
jgi:hypothetical protein